jgi:hypothetical protein
MPTHLADEDGNYPPEVAKSFTTEQREEYLNEYPIVPNRYRVCLGFSIFFVKKPKIWPQTGLVDKILNWTEKPIFILYDS